MCGRFTSRDKHTTYGRCLSLIHPQTRKLEKCTKTTAGVRNYTATLPSDNTSDSIPHQNPNQCQQTRFASWQIASSSPEKQRQRENQAIAQSNLKTGNLFFLLFTFLRYVIGLGELIYLGWEVEKGQSRLIKGLPPHFLMTTLMNFQPRTPHPRCYRACVPNTSKYNVMPKKSIFSASRDSQTSIKSAKQTRLTPSSAATQPQSSPRHTGSS